jgi:hypothetical protein
MWFGYDAGGVSMYDGNAWQIYDSTGIDIPISSIFVDSKNRLWFWGAQTGKYFCFDSTGWSSFRFDTIPNLYTTEMSGIQEDTKGNIWIFANFAQNSGGPTINPGALAYTLTRVLIDSDRQWVENLYEGSHESTIVKDKNDNFWLSITWPRSQALRISLSDRPSQSVAPNSRRPLRKTIPAGIYSPSKLNNALNSNKNRGIELYSLQGKLLSSIRANHNVVSRNNPGLNPAGVYVAREDAEGLLHNSRVILIK